MVSGLVSIARIAGVVPPFALLGALGLFDVLAFGGCSNSECLRDDCLTSSPEGSVAGGQSSAGTSGSLPVNKKCSASSECATSQGQACVSGTCRLACGSHFDCQGFGECVSAVSAEGTAGHFCELGRTQKPGQFYTRCAAGTECDADNDFFCVGAGVEDLEAYCTTDCTDDSTCAPGYACTPLIRPPCQDICNLPGTPRDRQCVPNDQIGVGKPYQCGGRGVVRNACLPRKFCSPCQSDDDCLAMTNQVCAKDESGAKICTQLCDLQHPSCPWGSAATCGVWDKDLNLATCQHRFGQCAGSGKSCEPCLTDSDCGSQGACVVSSFTGERWCVDSRVSCSCGDAADSNGLCTGGGCPLTPGGLSMFCVDATPSSANSGYCGGANTANALSTSSSQTGCWPAN